MKKVVSIILLLVFLFNVGGYHIVFWGLRLQTDQQLAKRLDAELYDQDETLEIKIPLSLPYPVYGRHFERVNGAFEHNGEFFKLIKQRHENDTLYVICIRDRATRQLVNTMKDYVQLTSGLDNSTPTEKALNYLTHLVKDFYSQDGVCLLLEFRFAMRIMFSEFPQSFTQPEIAVHAPPPRV